MSDLTNLGEYSSLSAVLAAYPEGGKEGDYLYISGTKYRWNKYDLIWENAATVTESNARENKVFDGDVTVNNNLTVAGELRAKRVKQPNCGLFATLDALTAAYPSPTVGMWAIVGDTIPGPLYRCDTEGVWTATGETGGVDGIDVDTYDQAISDLDTRATALETANTEMKESIASFSDTDASLLKRIMGTDDNSNASTDPFIQLGEFSSLDAAITALEALDYTTSKYAGNFRFTVSGVPYFGTNYVQYYGTDDSSKTHYLQKLEGGLTLTNGVVSQYTSTYRTVWRELVDGAWTTWKYDGMTEWARNYMTELENADKLSKLKVSLALSANPSNGGEFAGSDITITVTATVTYDGTLVDPTSISGGESGFSSFTKQSTGVYVGTYTLSASSHTNGLLSKTLTVTAVYDSMSKSASSTYSVYAPIKFGSLATQTADAASITGWAQSFVKSDVAGTYTVSVTSGNYLHICVPAFMAVSSVTSSGFDVPVEAVQTVAVTVGSTTVNYNVYVTSEQIGVGSMTITLS